MDFGVSPKIKVLKIIKVTTLVIKNQAMGFMNGKMDGFTKGTLKMIFGMGMVNCTIAKN